MKKILVCVCCLFGYLFASEDQLEENYPQRQIQLKPQEKKILEESNLQSQKKPQEASSNRPIKGSIVIEDAAKNQSKTQSQENLEKEDWKTYQREKGEIGEGEEDGKIGKNRGEREWGEKGGVFRSKNFKTGNGVSLTPPFFDPNLLNQNNQEQSAEQKNLRLKKSWIYGTAVITTTFLDGSIKRSYGILLRDGMFVTSANMVYDKNVYARVSYAMMQDDSSLPFICVAKLSLKALNLEKGLAILETADYTDMYCNPRQKSFYHDRIYSKYWVDVFDQIENPSIVYSPYITQLNSFIIERNILRESLEQLAKKESNDFEGYRYAYGKGFYTQDGKLIGMIGASDDEHPKLIRAQEIVDFLCELRESKILKNTFLIQKCPPKRGN